MSKKPIKVNTIKYLNAINADGSRKNQAQRVLDRFGGLNVLLKTFREIGLEYAESTIRRWTYPKEKGGTGGVIPTQALNHVFIAAQYEGVVLTSEDIDPRLSPVTQSEALIHVAADRQRTIGNERKYGVVKELKLEQAKKTTEWKNRKKEV